MSSILFNEHKKGQFGNCDLSLQEILCVCVCACAFENTNGIYTYSRAFFIFLLHKIILLKFLEETK